MLEKILKLNKYLYFIIICLCYVVVSYMVNTIFITEELFINTYIEQLTEERIIKMFNLQREYRWLIIGFTPVVLFFKANYTSLTLYIGSLFHDKKISYGTFLNFSIKAETVFLLYTILKFVL
ncbi:MAG: hypothetical protein NZM44_07390, partial [Candidatus Calescibacterium sp.]|nr:hypothetical protein [Candidatus Calescibacterium sp.]